MITKDAVTAVANYLQVNIFELFRQAAEWNDEGIPEESIQRDYDHFIRDQVVVDYMYEYCELITTGME